MIRKSFCEQFIRGYSTAIRIAIALNLVNKYGLTQFQAAKAVGLPQPLLNYIIQGRRRIPNLERILRNEGFSELIDELSYRLLSKGAELNMCEICIRIRKTLGLPFSTREGQ